MKKQENKGGGQSQDPAPDGSIPVQDAMREISKENEDLNPGEERIIDGPGAPPEGPAADVPTTTSHSGQTTRGSYATDSSTGTGRYMDRTTGTFGMEPLDQEGEDDPIDTKI